MRKILSCLMIMAAFVVAKPGHAQEKIRWNELDAFHEVISQTFHPSEEGKLEPVRSRSQEMLDKAIAWKNSTAPEGYDKNAMKKSLQDLVKIAGDLNKLVKENAADGMVKEKLSALHDVFHKTIGKCSKCEEEEKSQKRIN